MPLSQSLNIAGADVAGVRSPTRLKVLRRSSGEFILRRRHNEMGMCDVGWRRREMCGAVPPALLLMALFHHRAAARRWRSPLRHSSDTRDSSSWRGRGSSSWHAGVRARRRGGSLCCAGRRWSRRRCSRRGMMRCATRCGCSKARLAAGTAGLARLPRRERRARPRLIAQPTPTTQ